MIASIGGGQPAARIEMKPAMPVAGFLISLSVGQFRAMGNEQFARRGDGPTVCGGRQAGVAMGEHAPLLRIAT
jgi:hypothetical protein